MPYYPRVCVLTYMRATIASLTEMLRFGIGFGILVWLCLVEATAAKSAACFVALQWYVHLCFISCVSLDFAVCCTP